MGFDLWWLMVVGVEVVGGGGGCGGKRRNREGRERTIRGEKHNKIILFFLQYCEQYNSMFRIVL